MFLVKDITKPADLNFTELSILKARMKWMNRINRTCCYSLRRSTFQPGTFVFKCNKSILKSFRVETPVLILKAEKRKIMDNKNLEKLSHFFHAESMLVPQAKHEILFERITWKSRT